MSKLALTLFYLLYNLKYIRKVFSQASGEDKYKSQDSFKIKKKLHNFSFFYFFFVSFVLEKKNIDTLQKKCISDMLMPPEALEK